MESDSDLYKIFKDSVRDLLFPSEIDAPFEVIIWDKTQGTTISPAAVLELTGHKTTDFIQETRLEILFSTPTMQQDWHSPEDKEKVKRFRALTDAITRELKEVHVYRLAKINIEVFILGRTPSGN